MPASVCIRCGLVSDSVAEGGLCATCRIRSDETHPLDPDAGTATRDPVGGSTASAAGGEWVGVLPPGGYRYEEPIGEGGMGVVWRAVRVSTGETVAIKKLLPDCFTATGLRRFVAEARALAAVKHGSVVRLYDFVPDPADPFLVMEFVPGQPLSRHLKEIGPLHPDRAARLIAAAARGVQAAHDAGVIHRDLKPANLLVTPDGTIKVVDFGLGKRLTEEEAVVPMGAASTVDGGESPAAETVTRTGQMAGGTPGFMAPEQVDAELGQADRLADVWGLGACLYALLTNQTPFPSGKSNLRRVLSDTLVPPQQVNPAIPVDLAAIVVKCLQKDPGQRYPSAAALADDLDRFVDRDSTTARPKTWPARAWRRLRRTPRVVVIAIAFAGLVLATGVTLALAPWRQPDPLAAAQATLRSGKELVLVEKGRPPEKPDWLLESPPIMPPETEDGGFSFASREMAMLVLLRDPGIDRYRITAVVSHCRLSEEADMPKEVSKGTIGMLGLFWGYRQTEFPDGVKVMANMALDYSDYQPDPAKPAPRQLAHHDIGHVLNPREFSRDQFKPGPRAPLDIVPKLPGPWRTLVVDVTPEGVTLHLPNGSQTLTADDLTRRCGKLEDNQIELAPGRELGTRTWSPRSPLGVFVDRGRIAVRWFTVTPLTP